MSSGTIPVADVTLDQLMADPFSAFGRMRELGRVVWVPSLDRFCVTRYDDIVELERNTDQFSVADLTSPTVRALGVSILSKDGEAHRRERSSCEPALRPNVVMNDWAPVFQRNTDDVIDSFAKRGHADLANDFGGRLAARNVADMIGFQGVSEDTMLTWARAIVAACGNYVQDQATFSACDEARRAIDAQVAQEVDRRRATPDASIVSAMVNHDEDLTIEEIGRNVAVIIGGGINEPNHAISTAVLGLLLNPDQLAEVQADQTGTLWKKVFEEAMRWIAPLGVTLRKTIHAGDFAGVHLEEGVKVMGMYAAAHRDGERYESADAFDIHRPAKPHLAFGSGAHMCLGTWMARVSVGQIAVPTLFRRLSNLRLAEPVDVVGDDWSNWMFRGLSRLEVVWDTA